MGVHSIEPGSRNNYDENRFAYAWRIGGFAFSLLLIAVGLSRSSTTIVALGAVIFAIFAILLLTSIWALHQSGKLTDLQTIDFLYKLSQTRASDPLVCIDLGLHWPANTISQHLTSGQMVVIDIYNPQLMPAKSLVRARRHAQPPLTDPRLVWYDSNLELLPLPDDSVSAVFLVQILSELAQKGDQLALLKEIRRIMEPNGRLLIAEMADTWPNRLLPGSSILHIHPQGYWNSLLSEAGFELRRTQTLRDITVCLRADMPSPFAGKQMELDLDFEVI